MSYKEMVQDLNNKSFPTVASGELYATVGNVRKY